RSDSVPDLDTAHNRCREADRLLPRDPPALRPKDTELGQVAGRPSSLLAVVPVVEGAARRNRLRPGQRLGVGQSASSNRLLRSSAYAAARIEPIRAESLGQNQQATWSDGGRGVME